MKTVPKEIFEEYKTAQSFKDSIGGKGLAAQSKINERFYRGDQWYGVSSGGERPLVRHNVIKRIGDYKMSQILSNGVKLKYTADEMPCLEDDRKKVSELKAQIKTQGAAAFGNQPDNAEITLIAEALSENRGLCAERLQFDTVCAKALKDAYVTGTGIIYTFWEPSLHGNKGDIACEVLSVNDVFFADPYEKDPQKQPYIIISGWYDANHVIREAESYGNPAQKSEILKSASDNKVQVLTKLYKEYTADNEERVMCVKVTENAVIRNPFATLLKNYPIAIFCFEEREDIIYGDTEITYLIPNQIAINRMITANVWSSMSTGMPIMVVNGDTVSADISNDPGQIIKIYGSNEDVKGAISFISPPDFSKDFCENINNLIQNTLTQSGASAAVLGDEILNNATALSYIRNSALLSLEILRKRYLAFIKQVAFIWADFFMSCYVNRQLKMKEEKDVYFIPFNAERYKNASLIVEEEEEESAEEGGKALPEKEVTA